nr:hypothetical protein [Nonomuraea sp. SYSU D8015]
MNTLAAADTEPVTLAVLSLLLGLTSERRRPRHARAPALPVPYLPGHSGYNKRLRLSGAPPEPHPDPAHLAVERRCPGGRLHTRCTPKRPGSRTGTACQRLLGGCSCAAKPGEATGVNALIRSVGSPLGSPVIASILAHSGHRVEPAAH